MNRHLYFLRLFLSLFLGIKALSAQDIPTSPDKYVPLHDYAKVLKQDDFKALTQKLILYEDSTSTQIIIVVMDTLSYPDIVAYGHKMFQEWKIGQKGVDNGLLLLVALKNRKIRLEVGYGLEAKLPDTYCDDLIKNKMGPRFREGKYYEALDTVVSLVIKKLGEEFKALEHRVTIDEPIPQPKYKAESFSKSEIFAFTILLVVILLGFLLQLAIGYFSHYKKGRSTLPLGLSILNIIADCLGVFGMFNEQEEELMLLLLIAVPVLTILIYLLALIPPKGFKSIGKVIIRVLSSLFFAFSLSVLVPNEMGVFVFIALSILIFILFTFGKKIFKQSGGATTRNYGRHNKTSSSNSIYSDYSDAKYSDYRDYSDSSSSSMGGGSSGGGGASGSW